MNKAESDDTKEKYRQKLIKYGHLITFSKIKG